MKLEHLYDVAIDLTRSMVARDRYGRLIAALRRALPCDAAALLLLEGRTLRPLATHGLVPEVMGRRFVLAEHPRLDTISRSTGPHLFAADSTLPDPFDGLIDHAEPHLTAVHSCLGIPLRVERELVGVLAADALLPHVFESVDTEHLAFLGALAAAALRTSRWIEDAESKIELERSLSRELLRQEHGGPELIGSSPALERIRSEIELVGATELAVLVTGETGVGKEPIASAIHASSRRSSGPLVHLNCAALPESLAESELFGHERGAFTGADATRKGRFEVADGGTLFLDEVGELPLPLQPKLLRALQLGEIQRVGSDQARHVDVRIVAATNRDLVKEIDRGRFRSDLYHRLCQFPVHVPPLRERREDVPILAALFAERSQAQLGTGPVRLTAEAHGRLAAHAWPGNVRELQNVIARAVLRAAHTGNGTVLLDRPAIEAELADGLESARVREPHGVARSSAEQRSLRERVDEFKRTAIRQALIDCDGNLAAAARSLGVQRSNLHATAHRLGLLRSRPSTGA